MYIDDFLRRVEEKAGKSPKRMGSSYSCCCPAHEDKNPSLSVSEASDGKILLRCHAGCSAEAVCAALDVRVSDLFSESKEEYQRERKEQEEYIYTDEDGTPLYKKVKGFNKKFFIQSFEEPGQWVKGLKSERRVLYRLPELITAREEGESIFVVEGEKDVERLRVGKLVATAPLEGAGSGLRAEYGEQLQGADVVLLFDEGKARHQRRDQWLKLLNGVAARVRVVKLPGLEYREKGGEDVSDWLRKGHTVEELLELTEETKAYSFSTKPTKGLVAIDLEEFLDMKLPQREMILSPIIPEQGLAMLYSRRGVGKTFLSLAIGYAVATGIPLLRWQSLKPVPVLYVDGEMPSSMMQERLAKLIEGTGTKLADSTHFRLVTSDLQNGDIPDISTKDGQHLLESIIGDAKLIILDNLSTLASSVQENESDAWGPIQSWVLKLRRKGLSVLLVHHAGKKGTQRGTSRKEDALDTVILLENAEGYATSDGAAFGVHIQKARGFFGKDAESFFVTLGANSDDALCWSEKRLKEDFYDEVIEGVRSGKSIREIEKELQIKKYRVEKIIKQAREQGDLEEISAE